MELSKIKQAIIVLVVLILIINLYYGMYLSLFLIIMLAFLVSKSFGQIDLSHLQNSVVAKNEKRLETNIDEQPDSITEKKDEQLDLIIEKKDEQPDLLKKVSEEPAKLFGSLKIDFVSEVIKEIDENLNKFSSPEKAIRYFVNRSTDELINDLDIELMEGESKYVRSKHRLLPIDLEQKEGVPVKVIRNGILSGNKVILRADVEIIK